MEFNAEKPDFDWDKFLANHPNSLASPPMNFEEFAQIIAEFSPERLAQIRFGSLANLEPDQRIEAAKSILLSGQGKSLMDWVDIELDMFRYRNRKNQPRLHMSNPDYSRDGIRTPKAPGGTAMYKGHGKGWEGQWEKPK